jgi:hypothetical protein
MKENMFAFVVPVKLSQFSLSPDGMGCQVVANDPKHSFYAPFKICFSFVFVVFDDGNRFGGWGICDGGGVKRGDGPGGRFYGENRFLLR